MFRYFTMFIFMTLLGYLYEKYRLKNDENEELAKYDAVKRFLLNEDDLLSSKPIMWIFNDYEVNARSWPSFFSRNTTHLNQPYIELCVQSIIKNCGDTFNICLIDDESFSKLIPDWDIDFNRLSNPVKKHMRLLALSRLLYYYGGLAIPNSTIVLKDLMPTFKENLKEHDAFTFEIVNRGSTSTYTSFFPTCKFIKDSHKDKGKIGEQKKNVEKSILKRHRLIKYKRIQTKFESMFPNLKVFCIIV